MKKFLSAFCMSVTVAQIILLLSMTIIVNWVVVTRYFFSWSPSWSSEFVRYAMVWSVMLGAGILALYDDHIALYMAVEKFGPRMRKIRSLISQIIILVIGILIAWKGYLFATDLSFMKTPGLRISMMWPTLSIPVAGAIITVFSALNLYNIIANIMNVSKIEIPDQNNYMDGAFKPTDHEH